VDKKFWITGIVCTLVAFLAGFVVHGLILGGDYKALPNLFRPETEAQGFFPFMILAHIMIGFAFAWIYRQGITPGQPWLIQGVRFGIAVAFLTTIPMFLIYYAIQPMPGALVGKQIVFDSIATIINGMVAAFINKE
jgi:hypothetical protein